MPLDLALIRELVRLGASAPGGQIVDPSLSDDLVEAGVGRITPHIEQLMLLNITTDPMPLFGERGGMWIGYKLTDHGRALADSDDELRRAVAELTGDARSEVPESVLALKAECEAGVC